MTGLTARPRRGRGVRVVGVPAGGEGAAPYARSTVCVQDDWPRGGRSGCEKTAAMPGTPPLPRRLLEQESVQQWIARVEDPA
jgi:hypothetical protein